MSFIEINPDFKALCKILVIVADALELIVFHQFKVRSGHLLEKLEDPHPDIEDSVGYASDEATVKEAVERLRSRGITDPTPRMIEKQWEEPQEGEG